METESASAGLLLLPRSPASLLPALALAVTDVVFKETASCSSARHTGPTIGTVMRAALWMTTSSKQAATARNSMSAKGGTTTCITPFTHPGAARAPVAAAAAQGGSSGRGLGAGALETLRRAASLTPRRAAWLTPTLAKAWLTATLACWRPCCTRSMHRDRSTSTRGRCTCKVNHFAPCRLVTKLISSTCNNMPHSGTSTLMPCTVMKATFCTDILKPLVSSPSTMVEMKKPSSLRRTPQSVPHCTRTLRQRTQGSRSRSTSLPRPQVPRGGTRRPTHAVGAHWGHAGRARAQVRTVGRARRRQARTLVPRAPVSACLGREHPPRSHKMRVRFARQALSKRGLTRSTKRWPCMQSSSSAIAHACPRCRHGWHGPPR